MGRMMWALTLLAVVVLPGCAKVGGAFVGFGQWVQGLERTSTVQETTRERRRVQR